MVSRSATQCLPMGKIIRLVAGIAVAIVAGGCSKPVVRGEAVFFPPSPDPPRIQYLTAISSAEDLVEKSSSFSLFLTGKDEEERLVTIHKPYGITVNKGKIYVCDLAGRVIVINPEKKAFDYLDGKALKGMKKPINIAFDEDDAMYIADIERREVLVFNSRKELVRALGKEQGIKPSDVAVDNEFIYVLDMAGSEIKMYDRKTGEFAQGIGRSKENEKTLAMPTSFAMDSQGLLYTTNIVGANVIKMDRDGHYLTSFGKLGDGFGDFARPKGIAVDPEGRIYIVDNGMQMVNIYNDAGKLLLPFGAPGMPKGSLNLPIGVAVTKETIPYFKQFADPSFDVEYLIFVTNQYGNAKISVYGLGQRKQGAGEPTRPAVKKEKEAAK